MVEGVGVYPDPGFEVYDRPEEVARGKEPSIEAAVKNLPAKLDKNPSKPAPNPEEPDYPGWFEEEIR